MTLKREFTRFPSSSDSTMMNVLAGNSGLMIPRNVPLIDAVTAELDSGSAVTVTAHSDTSFRLTTTA